MRVLVGWDDPDENELLTMYLEAGDNEVTLVGDPEALVAAFQTSGYDVVLFPVTFPDGDRSFATFESLRGAAPDTPVIVAARPGEIYALSRFISHGVEAHVYRDPAKEYLFLMQALLESALAAKRAEQARLLTEKLRSEIDSVRKLQESMVPRDMSAPPGYELVARYEPSQINVSGGVPVVLAGGDYYYAFLLADGKMVFLVGDASGHGIKACMAIMSMHTLINQLQENLNSTPDEFVTAINRQLCGQQLVQDQGGFITLIYGVIQNGVLRWTSAGHCLPLLQNLETGEITELGDPENDGGLPLAVYEDAEYTTVTTEMPPASRLMIYTDGIVEAMPGAGEHRQFGLGGVKDTLRRCGALPLTATLDALFQDSQAFTDGGGRHDDTSVLLLERHRTP